MIVASRDSNSELIVYPGNNNERGIVSFSGDVGESYDIGSSIQRSSCNKKFLLIGWFFGCFAHIVPDERAAELSTASSHWSANNYFTILGAGENLLYFYISL